MVKFKCLASNNIFEFQYEVDIISMRKHPGYIEVTEEQEVEKVKETQSTRKYQRKNQTHTAET